MLAHSSRVRQPVFQQRYLLRELSYFGGQLRILELHVLKLILEFGELRASHTKLGLLRILGRYGIKDLARPLALVLDGELVEHARVHPAASSPRRLVRRPVATILILAYLRALLKRLRFVVVQPQ